MRNDVDRFGYNEWNPILPSFILTVTALETVATEEQLSYAVPLTGINSNADEIYINLFLEATAASSEGIIITKIYNSYYHNCCLF